MFQCRLLIPQFSGSNFIRNKKIFLKTLVTHLQAKKGGMKDKKEKMKQKLERKLKKEKKEEKKMIKKIAKQNKIKKNLSEKP